ncbi:MULTISPECIES: glycosyl hydrolase family 8 [unclassified Paenibacillus]|uniref:glycosyl hydrolase family 8 n=1 Tax=unclassified Paenibacillus TaxID=185978 RepID=UPI0005A60183|nr:glycosyl hydrolase family 8 [Paenibacillus sp. FSL H7-0737]
MRKIIIAALAIFAGIIGLTACEKTAVPNPSNSVHTNSPAPVDSENDTKVIQTQEVTNLEQFITSKLTGEYGVYTNFIETDQSAEAASGHEVLSESASLRMLAAVRSGQQERFAEQWQLAKQTFDINSGFSYRYSPKQQKLYPLNAAVDDLRMIQALYEAGEKFGDKRYTAEADKYGERLYDYNVKDGKLYDFYDMEYSSTNTFVTLCYINLGTLRKMSIPSQFSKKLTNDLNVILENGYLSDEFPFYETRFNYESGKYSSENINTVESLLSILALAEVGQQKATSIDFIKQQVEAGTLYGQYSREGKPLNDIRSTAIYAITAMIGSEIGDESLHHKSIERMNEFRVTDVDSPLYGGFGDVASGQAYSFDNLMALLAYVY